jgi:hypothetical protein
MNKPGGFCFLNNAGIAAKHAQQKYGVKKVAVLDFDVHHGNGKRSRSRFGSVYVRMFTTPISLFCEMKVR